MSLITSVRREILTALKANSTVTAIVPAARIYPSKTPDGPTYPFIRYGAASMEPHSLSCWKGGTVSGMVHCFVGVGGAIVDAEATCGDLTEAMSDCIGALSTTFATSFQIMADSEEPDVWHGFVQFETTLLEERP